MVDYTVAPDLGMAAERHEAAGQGGRTIADDGSYVLKALALALLFALAAGCFTVLRPFLAAILWAAILAVSTWPIFAMVERALHGRRALAALATTLGLAAILLLPLVLLGMRLTENVVRLADTVQSAMAAGGAPPAPAWLADIPFVGKRLASAWQTSLQDGEALAAIVREHVGPARDWLLARGADLAAGLLQLTLSLLTLFFFYKDGPVLMRTVNTIVMKVTGSHGVSWAAAGTIKSVVHGLLGTALIQAILMAVGLRISGVPGALVLGFASFFLSLIPLGLVLIWLPAALWLSSQGANEWALFMAVWGFVVGMIDNFLRPYLIGQGSDLPFLLVLLGVIGGAAGFGLIGIFLGPTLLAVAYGLIWDWSSDAPPVTGVIVHERP